MAHEPREHGPEVPDADAEEQARQVAEDDVEAPEAPEPTNEADAADMWEQRHEVPLDDEPE